MQEQVRAQLNRGELRFLLFGEKLRGEFALVRQPRLGGNAWLLLKKRDQYASDADVTMQERSVLSGKRLGGANEIETIGREMQLGSLPCKSLFTSFCQC